MAPAMLNELEKVLSYERFQPRLNQLELVPSEMVAYAMHLASIFEALEGDPIVVADPNDDVFLRCALVAGADYVISGDRHLLNLGKYGHVSILSASDFLVQVFSNS
jgi:putative PIN family toxin of toxin-antitoxin system